MKKKNNTMSGSSILDSLYDHLMQLYKNSDGLADFVLTANRHGYSDSRIMCFITKRFHFE